MKKQHWYSRSRSSSAPATPRDLPAGGANLGCMSMVHYLIFAPGAGCVGRPPPSSHHAGVAAVGNNSHHVKSSSSSCNNKGGLEAPRNSLELDADQLKDIQIGVQIEPAFDALLPTAGRASRATAPSSDAGTPRTPSLVARLMGIDGLPDQPSPSPGLKKSSSCGVREDRSAAAVKEKKKRVIPESMNKEQQPRQPLRSLSCNVNAGEARSLRDTPRASTSSVRATVASAWDVVDRPRLSLQVLRENVLDTAAQYMSMPTSPMSSSCGAKKKKKDREDGHGGHRRRDAKEHAREIVRQAKETVANRNKYGGKKPTSTGSSNKENASPLVVEDKLVVVQVQAAAGSGKPAAPPPLPLQEKAQADQQPHAPRLAPPPPPQRAKPSRPPPPPPPPLQQKAQSDQQPHAPRLPPPPPPQRAKPSRSPPPPPPLDHPTQISRVAPPPQTQQAIKSKRPPDGCERFATRIKKPGAGAAATVQQAAPAAPPPPSTAAPGSFTIVHHRKHPNVAPTSTFSRSLEEEPECSYLRTVLERGGFMRPPPPHRPFKGHSVSLPVDPIVFHLLELELPTDDEPRLGPLRHRWNRKLLFHLAQEILADILLLGGGLDASCAYLPLHGEPLLRKVWHRVKGFPATDCRVVGDIDALVAEDLGAASVRGLGQHPGVVEESGNVAEYVAERVLDALLGECCGGVESLGGWSPPSRAPR